MADSLRGFGPLTTYSTFNFENQLGLLTRSCKSTRRHATGIMNNLMYLRDACFQSINKDMHPKVRELVLPWLHTSGSFSTLIHDRVHVLYPVPLEDLFFNTVFRGNIVYYSTVFIGRVRFTTTCYARVKVSDDSSIIFKAGSKESFARIRRIFTVNNGEPMFYVGLISDVTDFEITTSIGVYSYSGIQTGLFEEEANSLFIGANDIIEKCVFYERP